MKNREEVSKKIARTLLAMSLVYAGGMFASCEKADAANPVSEKPITTDSTISEEFNIQSADFAGGKDTGLLVTMPMWDSSASSVTADFTGKIAVDATNTTADALVVNAGGLGADSSDQKTGTVNLKHDVVLKAAAGHYALLLTGISSYQNAMLKVNTDGNHTVQLLGDVGVGSSQSGTKKNLLELHLTNPESYLAGELKLPSSGVAQIKFNLANGATWYPVSDTYTANVLPDDTTRGMEFALDGGIIDLYHSQPGVARASGSARTFTLNEINNDVSGTNGTTFRIGSDVMGVNNGGTGTADKIVLNGDTSYSGVDKYFIQIVADPSISSSVPVMDVADKKIVVAQLNGNMTSTNTTVTGSTYKDLDLDAGLTLADVKTTLGAGDTAGEYIIEKIDLENIRSQNSSGEKGSALTLAEIGATTMLNVASAWRAENNDLLRRMGDLRTSSDDAGVWVRMYGGKNEVVQGQRSDLSYKAVQGGYDFQNNLKNGRLFTGFTVSHLDGDVSGSRTDGDINSTMFGVYSSYVGDKGHFADLIVKYGRINSDFTTIKGTDRYGADYGSNGFSITTEYGYRQNLKNNFYIEPQAELTYSRIGGSDYTMNLNDKDGAKVSNDAFNSLIGRIGFTAGRQQEQSNVYAKLSLAREFKGEVATSASYGDVTRSYAGGGSDTWLEYGIGFNAKMSKGTNLYGEIEKTTGSVIRTKWRANMGLRYSF
ncbi:autotransporter outer membrane beta-barrel domain-containing protein [uncultured Phascolarctobacterium sp.]|mgnify:CR=1 FL=1|uniref:autotransporter outer membrane beta-barrel domain-containing protein n=1 Tax=uncultured Phascolarctobacterium sp. TaxID=512296 RepID=UPI0025F04166|nr:autotransporter outer membrane beta-barrel domain-containing protein [uncultured Phascolarctobacterium sp.]